MKYKPVSITYISKNDKDAIFASSGINIITKNESYVLTINHIPHISDYKIYVNHGPNKLENIVNWKEVRVVKEIELIQEFKYFKNEFNIFPCDQFPSKTISLVKLTSIPTTDSHDFEIDSDIKVGEAIKVISSPFNLTNPFIFQNFVNYAHIVNQLQHNYYLSDLKYLDNTNGGIVINPANDSILGLIVGNLRKINGDGDLTIIIPFDKIFRLLSNDEIMEVISSNSVSSSSVVPIKIKTLKKYTWGSCVYYEPNVLITNHHVISPLLTENSSTAEIILSNKVIYITKEQVKTPTMDLDLSFIYLKEPLPGNIPVKSCTSYTTENKVYTESYGLYLNENNLSTMICPGYINYIYTTNNNVNGMIIASTSCFNGSSGGGLFNFNNEFIGVICSNAQVKKFKSYQKEPEDEFEKITNFTFILPVDIINYCFDSIDKEVEIDSTIIDLWKLKPFHQEEFIDYNKFKL
ncbi:hypothetical protein KGF54_000449 [Candida jiufengensis]|uniref:uncharacterized protein n=1 Tax=Candida jiufengensis TaxID=497108 RepID=UPI0022240525|nr:uncharacterized protein KGF54_000449 [Candida jiufengensis]KAI5956831.1 hypothetical protein KGF54_000449 [Candida jiufengensis]